MKKLLKRSIFVLVFASFCVFASAQTQIDEDTPGGQSPTSTGNSFLDYLDNPAGLDDHLRAHRVFDMGLPSSVSVGLANNLKGVGDILQKTIVLDFNEMKANMDSGGWKTALFFDINPVSLAFNMPLERRAGGSLTVSTRGELDLTVPKSLFQLISEGNAGSKVNTGDVSVSGAVFASADIDFHMPIYLEALDKRLHVGITPSYYVPLVYIPGAKVNYILSTPDDGSLTVDFTGSFDVYSAIDLKNISEAASTMDLGGGVDFSLYAEYPLFSRLDLGLTLTHIPLFPAKMDHGLTGTLSVGEGKHVFYAENAFGVSADSVTVPEFNFDNFRYMDTITVLRPLKFDFYALFRPTLGGALIIRPNLGYTFATSASEYSINFGLELSTNPHWLFQAHIFTGHEDGFWTNEAGINLNLRVFEVVLAAALRSQNFLGSWEGDGASVTIGLHWGF